MIRFAQTPTPEFQRIVNESFQYFADRHDWDKDEMAHYIFEGRAEQYGGTDVIFRLIDHLERAHKSVRLWQLTDWHWYMMYMILDNFVELHNGSIDMVKEMIEEEKEKVKAPKSSKKKSAKEKQDESEENAFLKDPFHTTPIHFEEICDSFFWDEDFFLDQDVAALPGTQLALGLSEATIHFIDKMPARPQDLEIKEWVGIEEDNRECSAVI